jgi:hypothetical protein
MQKAIEGILKVAVSSSLSSPIGAFAPDYVGK